MDSIEVDGSLGEGGGQILRTSVAFSVITGVPVKVVNVRAGRSPPGLKRQHASVLKILAEIFGGDLVGAAVGSSEVSFSPGEPRLGTISFDMGTAASITLVLQAIIPAVALRGASLSIELAGGTDVPWSPTFDYFERVVLGGYRAVGIEAEVSCARRGYYPKGGGLVRCVVKPCKGVVPLDLGGAADAKAVSLVSRCARLPLSVAERQSASASSVLKGAGLAVDAYAAEEDAPSPGSSILAYHVAEGVFVGADALGARGKQAERVGAEAAERFIESSKSGPRLDSNLADMIVPLLTFAGSGSSVRIPRATPHLVSGLRLAEQFTGCKWNMRAEAGGEVATVIPSPKSREPLRHNV